MSSHALRIAVLGTALAGVFASAARAQSVDATLGRASDAWASVKTARGTFEQTLSNPLTGSTATARGTFEQQRPNKLSIRFTEPSGDRIVSDGRSVWVYLPSSAPGQVIKRPATEAGAVPVDLTGQFLDQPRTKYDVTDAGADTVAGRSTHELVLVPKPGRQSAFTKATVWVDDKDGMIRQFEVVEQSGITRRIRITSMDANVAVDREAFVFSPPQGVRVVEGR